MAETRSLVERRKEETRREILDAALACFSEVGYHETAISDIAGRVGIAQGTFYRYFQSKRDIVDEVLTDLMTRIAIAMAAIPPETPSTLDDYRKQADTIAEALMGVFSHDLRAARFLLMHAAAVDDDMFERVLTFYDMAAAIQAAYLHHGVTAGYFRPDLDVEAAARAVNGMILAAVQYRLRDPSPEVFERMTQTAREIIYFGLAGDPGK